MVYLQAYPTLYPHGYYGLTLYATLTAEWHYIPRKILGYNYTPNLILRWQQYELQLILEWHYTSVITNR